MKFRKLLTISSVVIFTFAFSMTSSTTYADDINVWDFNCTGKQQVFTALHTGTYTLEVWGGQGGGQNGGKGGYSKGEFTLSKGQILYVYVGGQGGSPCGGSNGGGNSGTYNGYTGSGGGGSTDIRFNGQDLSNRIIVAGGGGGGTGGDIGGAGGGIIGEDGIIVNGYSYVYAGGGGTQTSGGRAGIQYDGVATCGTSGSLGQGGNGGRSSSLSYGDGGGAGYFGGGGAGGAVVGSFPGAGGSSYIGGVKNANTIAGNTSMPCPSGDKEVGQPGNGYARIRYKRRYANGIVINKRADNLEVGETDKLTACVIPDDALVKTVKWTSSNPSIVTVDDSGNITSVKAGTAIITATVQDGRNLHGQCRVCVTD